jgi:hypothetical protein
MGIWTFATPRVTGNVAKTCRYFGITRQSYDVWLRRYFGSNQPDAQNTNGRWGSRCIIPTSQRSGEGRRYCSRAVSAGEHQQEDE